jgi:hypothetical protein
MNRKEEFKNFVKSNPNLAKYVNEGKMTWQKFYEMYDLYGEDSSVWNDYINNTPVVNTIGLTEILNMIRNVDLDSVQNSVNSFQRVIGLLQDLGNKDSQNQKEEYRPRPIYKHFED